MEYKNIIGIDPGIEGCASTYYNNKYIASGMDMNNYTTVKNYLKYLKTQSDNWIAFVEQIDMQIPRVSNIEKWEMEKIVKYINETIGKIQRIKKLVRGYTGILIALQECNIDYVEVHPMTWQSRLQLINRQKKETPTEKKNRHKKYASHIYNIYNINPTHQTADALLILSFGITILKTQDSWLNGRINKNTRDLFE